MKQYKEGEKKTRKTNNTTILHLPQHRGFVGKGSCRWETAVYGNIYWLNLWNAHLGTFTGIITALSNVLLGDLWMSGDSDYGR